MKNTICKIICLTACAMALSACADGETAAPAGGTGVPVETQTAPISEASGQSTASESDAVSASAQNITADAGEQASDIEQSDREKIRAANQAAQYLYAAVQAALEDMKAMDLPDDTADGQYDLTGASFTDVKKEDNLFYYLISVYYNDVVKLREISFCVEDGAITELYAATTETLESFGDGPKHYAVGKPQLGFTYEDAEYISDTASAELYLLYGKCKPANDGAKQLYYALASALTDLDTENDNVKTNEYDGTFRFTRSDLEHLDPEHSKAEALLLRAEPYDPELTEWYMIAFKIQDMNVESTAVMCDTNYPDEQTGRLYTPYGTSPIPTFIEDAMKMQSIDDALNHGMSIST